MIWCDTSVCTVLLLCVCWTHLLHNRLPLCYSVVCLCGSTQNHICSRRHRHTSTELDCILIDATLLQHNSGGGGIKSSRKKKHVKPFRHRMHFVCMPCRHNVCVCVRRHEMQFETGWVRARALEDSLSFTLSPFYFFLLYSWLRFRSCRW